jgi:hypothetical protein
MIKAAATSTVRMCVHLVKAESGASSGHGPPQELAPLGQPVDLGHIISR